MAAKIEYWKLSQIQKDMFRKKLIDHKISIQNLPIEPHRTADGCYPLSWAQKEIFPFAQNEEEAAAYNLCNAIHINKPLKREILLQAIQIMVQKHEVLRIHFIEKDGKIYQKVREHLDVELKEIDMHMVLQEAKEQQLLSKLAEDGRIPFSVFDFPFFRCTLYQLNGDEYVLGMTIHHFITDGISLQMITADLLNTYTALERHEPVAYSLPEVGFTDYALWQNEWVQPDMLMPELDYWKQELAGIKGRYSLPEDYNRPTVPVYNGGFCSITVPADLTTRMRGFAADRHVSLFQLMLTVYFILVSRYRMDGDVAVSIPVSGRLKKEIQQTTGFFAHGMAIRTLIDEGKTFADVLKDTAGKIDMAFNNQMVPIDLIGEILEESDAENLGNIFDMFFTFHNYCATPTDIAFRSVEFSNKMAKGDCSVELTEREQHIDMVIEYNASLYKQDTIQSFASNYLSMLKNCLNLAEQTLHKIGVQEAKEAALLYVSFNDTKESYDYKKSLIDLMEQQAQNTPDLTALLIDGISYTYHQMMEEVGRLQYFLEQQGICPGDCIGIHLEPSKELLIALLAVSRGGATYVPLDPSLPKKRAVYIQKKAKLTAVLTDCLKEAKEKGDICPWYYIRSDAAFWEGGCSAPKAKVNPDDRVYIMFTSGSTGEPKGVQITHANVVNFLLSMKKKLGFKEQQSILNVTTYAFDISVLEMFLPLICGGKVIIQTGGISADFKLLKETIETYKPDYLQATPVLWQSILTERVAIDKKLVAICGGEVLKKDLAEELTTRFQQVWNMYGPTETTVWSLMHQLTQEEEDIYIGKPVGNTQVYLLDAGQQLVPPGITGRLYIGGAGVSPGYLDNPEETMSRFIDNPFGEGKLFYSGDLARCMSDGTYEFCGRDDQQVKIRGYRIETKEVELCLNQHEKIENCAVVAANGTDGEKVLAAYIQPKDYSNHQMRISDLREFIRKELPDYMVPTAFVFCEKLPVTYNLKINRKELMEKEIVQEYKSHYMAPQNRLQEMLVSIWEQAVQKERIGIQDDFYSIGGHSITTIKIKQMVYERLGIAMPLSWVSKYPTIRQMSEQMTIEYGQVLDSQPLNSESNFEIVYDKEHQYEPFDLTKVQTAYWLGRCSKGGLGGISTHIYRESMAKELEPERFENALNKVIKRHDMLRAVILADGRQQILKEVPNYHIKCARFTDCTAAEAQKGVADIRAEMAAQIFDHQVWPLFEVQISEMQDGRKCIHMSFDCLIGDARSFQIILKELAMVYFGRETELPAIQIGFRDYVLGTQQLYDREEYAYDKQYWLNKLEDIPAQPLLPLNSNIEKLYKPEFARKSLTLEKEQYQCLKQIAKRNHITKTVVLLTAFSEILALYSKRSSFTLNLTLFDRAMVHPDIQKIVGDFTTGILLEINRTPMETFAAAAKRIQAQLMDNLEHRHFNSVDVTREMLNKGLISESFPVVFTSMLDAYEEELGFEEAFLIEDDEESLSNNISQTSQVWLDHQVMEWRGCLYLNWDYVEALFAPQLIDTMFRDYQMLLQELLKHETWSMKAPLTGGDTGYPYRKELEPALDFQETQPFIDKLLFSGFIRQAGRDGAQIAIITDEREITYGELDRMSDLLAIHILDRNAGSDCVGIVMEKGWQQVAAALAILKAGKAYVPVDAALPEKRIEKLLRICELDSCLTTPLYADRIDHQTNTILVTEEILHEPVSEKNKRRLESIRAKIDERNMAYIIFTSGSTGEPKGVIISHQGAVNTILDINQRFNVTKTDRILALSSLSFDLSVYDIFGMLCAGGAIVIPRSDQLKDPAYWNTLIGRKNITVWNSVPAFMSLYTAMPEEDKCNMKHLRVILLSGDWIPTTLPEKIWKHNPKVELISLGGATECSIWSVFYQIREVEEGQVSIPYGKSLSGQQVYVLNEKLMVCPVDVEGDIYIGGIGMAEGYWRDETKTREKFIRHPLSKQQLYHTGDIGKYDRHGNIIFLGRSDSQVKINGHRIECGEILAAIKRYPGVEDAVVMKSTLNKDVLLAFIKRKKQPDQDMILDASARKIFKLEQNNIRKDTGLNEITLGIIAKEKDYRERKSYRNFLSDPIPFENFSSMLKILAGFRAEGMLLPKYRYASAGSLYPVQTYLYVKEGRVENIAGGYYYYNPVKNSLMLLNKMKDMHMKLHVQQNQAIEEQSAFSIFLVADMEAIGPLYGRVNGELYSVLEAGAMTALLEKEGLDDRIGFCQIGIFDFDKIRERLQLSDSHRYIHMLLGGPVDASMIELLQTSAEQETGQVIPVSINESVSTDLTENIKDYLRSELPDYMVPQKIFMIERFPLTCNGKIDYVYLNNLEKAGKEYAGAGSFTTASAEEELILEIWKKVLEREPIGLHDNFFDIGGTSLKIVQVYQQLSQQFEQDFDVITLFQNPTIKSFAEFMSRPKQRTKVIENAAKRAQKRLDVKKAKLLKDLGKGEKNNESIE